MESTICTTKIGRNILAAAVYHRPQFMAAGEGFFYRVLFFNVETQLYLGALTPGTYYPDNDAITCMTSDGTRLYLARNTKYTTPPPADSRSYIEVWSFNPLAPATAARQSKIQLDPAETARAMCIEGDAMLVYTSRALGPGAPHYLADPYDYYYAENVENRARMYKLPTGASYTLAPVLLKDSKDAAEAQPRPYIILERPADYESLYTGHMGNPNATFYPMTVITNSTNKEVFPGTKDWDSPHAIEQNEE